MSTTCEERAYVVRLADPVLAELVRNHPAVSIVGPRACGKTTTAARLAAARVSLDVPGEAAAFRADPDAALAEFEELAGRSGGGPLLIDEWQEVPDVLGAVKRAVDRDPRPGRFLLTGSSRAPLEQGTWPGTGRLIRLAMAPLTQRELARREVGRPLFDLLAGDAIPALPPDVPDLRGYLELVARGGFPEPALGLDRESGSRWYRSYVDDMLGRDVLRLAAGRDAGRLRRYFEAYALNTAGITEHKTIYDAARISRSTADAYEELLECLFVVHSVPGWWSNRLKRLTVSPKRFLVDAALLGAFATLDTAAVLRDGALLGRLLETFAAAQIRAELELAPGTMRLYHLRQESGRHEIDFLIEATDGRIVAIEIKASSAPDRAAATHLTWLRDRLGERFAGGAVLHTGPRAYQLDDQVSAIPICALWA